MGRGTVITKQDTDTKDFMGRGTVITESATVTKDLMGDRHKTGDIIVGELLSEAHRASG